MRLVDIEIEIGVCMEIDIDTDMIINIDTDTYINTDIAIDTHIHFSVSHTKDTTRNQRHEVHGAWSLIY